MNARPEANMRHAEAQRKYCLAHPGRVRAIQRQNRRNVRLIDPARVHAKDKVYREKTPLQQRARRAVSNGIRDGRLIRPAHCSKCLRPCKPQAHHNDYEKPLEVIWLCRPCHFELEGKTVWIDIPGDPSEELTHEPT